MYEEITVKEQKPKKEWKLISVTTLAVAAVIFSVALFMGGYFYYSSFRTFAGEFSQTTSVNYRKGSATVMTVEETFDLSAENIYFVYNAVINAGRGRLGEAPARQPDVIIQYAFGGKLELWEQELKNSKAEKVTGLFIRYVGSNGYEYAYDTDRMTLDRLPLSKNQNRKHA